MSAIAMPHEPIAKRNKTQETIMTKRTVHVDRVISTIFSQNVIEATRTATRSVRKAFDASFDSAQAGSLNPCPKGWKSPRAEARTAARVQGFIGQCVRLR